MTCQRSTDLSGFFPEMSVITDQSDLLPDMLMIKIVQFPSPEVSVISVKTKCLSLYSSDLQIFPFPSLRCQWSPINLPAMLKIKIIQFLRCQWSSAIHGMPVIYISFRSLPWDVSDHRSIRSLTWHSNDQDHSVLFPDKSVIYSISIKCLSWHASDLQIFPVSSLRCQWSPINQISYQTC